MTDELVYQLSLELVPGIGNRGIRQLISYCGSASQVFQATKGKLMKIPGVGAKMAEAIISSSNLKEAERIILQCEQIGSEILHFTNSKYPQRLRQLPDAPNILHFKGNGEMNPSKVIAIVGTRKATNYGRDITNQIVADLSSLDVSVISGLAYGIDIQAHKEALKNKVPTFAVIAGGLDRIYPSAHKKYAEEMRETGGILSESLPGTKPDAHLFPARNRIIAGMVDATIVVEAAEKGGALITASIADSYGRIVFAVPGEVGKTYSLGTNQLIASQKALIYTGIEDIIYHLGWDLPDFNAPEVELPELTGDEEKIFLILSESEKAVEIDMLALQSETPINQVASLLLALEFKGLVNSLPGKKYELNRRR